ncbi:MAG: tsaE [Gammaproteobacteria bacterium]|jgi:tRNA threonylcarbamoyladenosine biosynthesis protein TsaE|nr:tsaE [Gammaproteobacteria bacterium]
MNQLIPDEASMLKLGEQFAKASLQKKSMLVIFLHGQLGAGKTTFTRGFLHGLGYLGRVKSPTYTLVESYDLPKLPVFHFDFYRLQDAAELEFMGIQDYFIPSAICLIEWPEKGGSFLPKPDLSFYFNFQDTGREVKTVAQSPYGQMILQRAQHAE